MRRITVLSGIALVSLAALIPLGCGGGGYGSSYGGGGGGGGGTITSIVISPAMASITVGGTQQFTAVAKDSMGNTVTGAALVWASSNTAVATVNNGGLATAKVVGSTGITASITYSGGVYGNPVTYTSNTATLTVTTMDAVMGTVAVGHALAGALVNLTDAQGRTESALSTADGRYQLSTAGLNAPFLLKADDGRGHVLFSAATQAGVANIDPLTDVMLRAFYGTRGTDAAAAFAAHNVPDAPALAALDKGFTGLMQDTLMSQGLDAPRFSLLSTAFDADGTGFDRVLDNTGISTANGRLLLSDRLSGRVTEIATAAHAITLTTRSLVMQPVSTVKLVELP
jgi:Bacterial Ig-like domain (group 2)